MVDCGYTAVKAILLLDLVGAAEQVVDTSKVVGAGEKSIGATLGGVALLQVSLLAKVAHLHSGISHVLLEQYQDGFKGN